MIQQDLIGFFDSVPHSRICSALQVMLTGTFRSDNGRIDISGEPQSRYQRPANLQRTAKISRIQHQGAADSTCHGTDRILVAVGILQGVRRHILSDARSLHGITVGTSSLCDGCSRTRKSEIKSLRAHLLCVTAASQFQVCGQQVLLLAQLRTPGRLGKT